MDDLRRALIDAVEEGRPYILVTIIGGSSIEILFGGNPECPPTWADVAEMLAYAAECASENAEEDHEIRGEDRERAASADGGRPGEGAAGPAGPGGAVDA